eukprot:5538442-Pleurochrysis_carterae.AAC.1
MGLVDRAVLEQPSNVHKQDGEEAFASSEYGEEYSAPCSGIDSTIGHHEYACKACTAAAYVRLCTRRCACPSASARRGPASADSDHLVHRIAVQQKCMFEIA